MSRRFILSGILAIIFTGALLAQPRSIASVGITSRPREWSGPCPAGLQFIATINANRWPVLVEYRWERSDGAVSGRRRIDVRSQHQRVSESWRLGRYGERFVVWERMHVLAPTNIESMQDRVNVVCR